MRDWVWMGLMSIVGIAYVQLDQFAVTSFPLLFSEANRDELVFGKSIHLRGSRKEVVSVVLRLPVSEWTCHALVIQHPAVRMSFYKMETVANTPKTVSYRGARVGSFFDPLVPTKRICPGDLVWMDVHILGQAGTGTYAIAPGLNLTIWKMVIPDRPSLPLYIYLNGHALVLAHRLPATSQVAVQAGLTRNYVAAYREHRIEPYGQSIFNYPPLVIKDEGVESDLDWDLFAQFGASYRQLVFEGAIAPPILFLPDPKNPPPRNVLQAIGKAIKRGEVPKGSMAYVWDEGEESPLMTERALSRAKWVKELAPGIRVMLTRAPSPGFLKYVDVFFVLQNLFSVPEGKPFGLYVSCVSQGSCVNGVRGYPSGTPMMVLDAPTIHPRAFLWLNHRLGASFSLYYNATQMLTTAWTHQYAFGGNGDGTLLYPDLHEGIPDVSIRMKMLRQGSFDVEYLTWAEKAGIHYQSPVKNQFQWSPRFSDYQRLRDELGTKLDARWHLSEVFHQRD